MNMDKNLRIAVGILAIFIVGMNCLFAPQNILSWDVFGYYLYLPLTFIYHDLGLSNSQVIDHIIAEYNNTATFYQGLEMPDGKWVMKYSMGMSFFYAPFFFLGWVIAELTNQPIDGFSAPFQYAIFIGGIIYSLIGLWFTAKVLNHFFKPTISIVTLFLIVLATNYMVHICMHGQNAMSQNYLFTGYAVVVWLTIKWHEKPQLQTMVFLGLISGLMVLSRPTEIVVFLIPILWGVSSTENLKAKVQLLHTYQKQVLLFIGIVAVLGSFQSIYWKLFAGAFLFNSYGANAGEGLDLLRPHTLNFLFSFRKGWFLYTPIMLLATTGFYIMYKKNKPIFFALFPFFIFNLYLISSWSNWWYAQSFSQRAMVSSYPLMAIALGYFLEWLFQQNRGVRIGGVFMILVFMGLNIFQTYQVYHGVIHGDRMTREYYFAVFGKTNVTEQDKKLLLIDRSFSEGEVFSNREEYDGYILEEWNFDDSPENYLLQSNSGCCSFELNENEIFTPEIETEYENITEKDHAWIKVSAKVFVTENDVKNPFIVVCSFVHNGFQYKFNKVEASNFDLLPNQWNKVEMDYLTPEVRSVKDKFRTYVRYTGNKSLFVDDLKVEVFEKRK
jgi:hypothetical protein